MSSSSCPCARSSPNPLHSSAGTVSKRRVTGRHPTRTTRDAGTKSGLESPSFYFCVVLSLVVLWTLKGRWSGSLTGVSYSRMIEEDHRGPTGDVPMTTLNFRFAGPGDDHYGSDPIQRTPVHLRVASASSSRPDPLDRFGGRHDTGPSGTKKRGGQRKKFYVLFYSLKQKLLFSLFI